MNSQPRLNRLNLISKYEFVRLGLMLLLLQLALQTPADTPLLSSALLIAHIGFFLLWQPALKASQQVQIKTLLPVVLINSLLYIFLGDWFIALWIILLSGLTGGSALLNGSQRSLYALSLVILILQLSLFLTPRLFQFEVIDSQIEHLVSYSLIIACGFIALSPNRKNRSIKIDYLHSAIISFGLFSFYLASILISYTSHIHYLQSMLITALSIAAFLLLLSLIYLPQSGLASIGQVWERHILNIGNPFENWVKQTSLLGKNRKITPELFLHNSIEHLLTLSWVSGIEWHDAEQCQLQGDKSRYYTVFNENDISITLYSLIPMGSALKIHAQLLMQLMCFFYTSKLREISLKNQIHLKAVYETGAKLTHDIKNILQSLQALTGAVQASDDPQQSHQLMQRQLPLLTQRLQNTLNKLQTKTDTGTSMLEVEHWWKELQSRYHGRDIIFEGKITQALSIDADIFDTVLENLLENARSKRRVTPQIKITTQIVIQHNQVVITVCDNGEPVSSAKAPQLFKQIIPSSDGYGIGLYQSAQLAERNGYKLELVNNETGKVCFRLSAAQSDSVPVTLQDD